MRNLRTALFVCLTLLCCGQVSLAQAVYGSTNLDIDPDTGTVTATCETDVDNLAAEYYNAMVSCVVEDSNHNIVASGGGSDDSGQGYVQAVLTFTGVPGETYTAMSAHSLFEIYTVEIEQDPPQPIRLHYYDDMYDFGFYSDNPETFEGVFDLESPGPETETVSQIQHTANTVAQKNYPKATISFNFTPNGSKNSQDLLSFLAHTAGECSELIGPAPCSAFWLYNLEGSVTVSDDASLWTLTQQKGSVFVSGASKDSAGTLHPFSKTFTYSDPSDNPDPTHLQATSGSKTIFWIDAPGRARFWEDLNDIDSMNWLQSYSVKVCSTVMPSICSTAAWYVQLIVNPGGQLSNTSVADTGSAPN